MDLQQAMAFVQARSLGGVMTTQPDGRPHASKIAYGVFEAGREVRISVTDDRVKTRNVRRDPRAGLFVAADSPWHWIVVEGDASLTPVAEEPGDSTCQALREVYRAVQGEHPDWDDFDQAMVRDRRLVLTIAVICAYGQLPD